MTPAGSSSIKAEQLVAHRCSLGNCEDVSRQLHGEFNSEVFWDGRISATAANPGWTHSAAQRDKLRSQSAEMRNFINYLSGVLDRREQLLQTHDRSSAQRRRRSTADVVPPAAMFLRSLLQFNERVMHLDQTQVPHLEDRMSQMHLRVQSTSQERARPISDPLTRPPGSRDLRLRQARALITQHREQSAAAKIRDLSGTQFIALNAQPDSLPDVSSEPCEQSKPLLVKDRHILKSGGNSTANVAFPSEETRPSDVISQELMRPSSSAAEQRENQNLALLATTRTLSGSTSSGATDLGRDAAKSTEASLSFSDQAHAKPCSPQEPTAGPSFGSSQPDTAPRASLAFSLGALDSEISRTSTLAPVLSETSSAGSLGGSAATAAASPPAKSGAIAYSSPPVSAGTNAPATSTLDFGAAALKIQDAKSGVNTLSTKPKAALAAAAAPTLAPLALRRRAVRAHPGSRFVFGDETVRLVDRCGPSRHQ